MKLSEYRAKRKQDPEYIAAAKKALRWRMFIEDAKLAFGMWWQSRFDAGYDFGRAFFGWLRWCKHGMPRRQACMQCGAAEWIYGPHGQFLCSGALCKSELEDSIEL